MKSSLTLRSIALAAGLFLGACGGGSSEVIAQTSVAAEVDGTSNVAVAHGEPLVVEPELISGQPQEIPTTTTSTTAPPSITPDTPELVDSHCVAGNDFPVFDSAAAVIDADMDNDGALDQVFLLDEVDGLGHNGWVAVIFASGGMATGQYDGFFEPVTDHALTTIDLTNGQDGVPEILFVASSGPAISQVAVMTLVDCSIATTTLFDKPFDFDIGAAPTYASSGGCAYGTGGRLEFTVTEQNPSEAEWTVTAYTLAGTTWTQAGRYSNGDLPNLESAPELTLTDCTGLTISQ